MGRRSLAVEDAEAVAAFYRNLIIEMIPPDAATALSASYVAGILYARSQERKPENKNPWEKDT